jgi:hypothetical protein
MASRGRRLVHLLALRGSGGGGGAPLCTWCPGVRSKIVGSRARAAPPSLRAAPLSLRPAAAAASFHAAAIPILASGNVSLEVPSFAVWGANTAVGKTLVSAGLCRAARSHGLQAGPGDDATPVS